jgi:hypothetical protein
MAYILSAYAGAGAQLFDSNGDPLVGGKLYTYLAGTTSPMPTYTTSSGAVANTNPIILNSAGRTPNDIWVTPGVLYKFVLETSTGTLIGTYDGIPGIDDPTAFNNLITVTGTNALVGTSNPAITGYTAGQTFSFVVANTNTGAATLDVDGQGAKDITVQGSTALAADQLVAGSVATVLYDGTRFQLTSSSSNALTTDNLTVTSINAGQLAGLRNVIINGDMRIAQRGLSFTAGANNDDAYTLDRWYILSDGNDTIDVSSNIVTIGGSNFTAIGLDVETVNKKFGIAQIVETNNCLDMVDNKQVTLSFKARVSSVAKLDNVKAAVVAWSGTANSVTSDIVSAWGAEGANPTLIANATYENTPTNLNVTTSWATYSLNAVVDTASTKNLIVFIWSDVTDTTLGDFLYITDVQLELGSRATPFERRPVGLELALCQRYFETIDIATSVVIATLQASSTTAARGGFTTFKTTKRTIPIISVTGTLVSTVTTGASAGGTVAPFSITDYGFNWDVSGASGLAAGDATLVVSSGAATVNIVSEL